MQPARKELSLELDGLSLSLAAQRLPRAASRANCYGVEGREGLKEERGT